LNSVTFVLARTLRRATVVSTPGGPPSGDEHDASGCPRVLDSGVYVLCALSRAEHAEYATHLQGCATCRHEVDQLAPLPALLAGIGASPSGTTSTPGIRVVAVRSRRRLLRAALLIAVAALVAAARQTGHRTKVRALPLLPRRTS
jgi:hypothetical protein